MKFRDLFYTATESLGRTKSRSVLTVLGIIIGIGAVILMLSIGQGAESIILNQVADLGSDLVFIEPSSGDPMAGPPNPFMEQTITLDDVKAMRKSGLFSAVSGTAISTITASRGDTTNFYQTTGTDQDQLDIFPADILYGSFIEETDVDGYSKVVVLGKEVSEDLFGENNPVGEKIKIKSHSFRVIGVLDEQGTRFFQNLDQQISIPVTTMMRDILGVDTVNYISARAIGDVEETKEELKWLIRDTHDLDNPEGTADKDDFFVSSQTDATEIIGVIGGVLTILLSSIAAISLVVGGIGIMNIMLVSVSERTREIGLRKAIGATEKEIMYQFLIEAILLTFVGGIVGILCGAGLSLLIGFILKSFIISSWAIVIPPNAIALGAIVSTVVGLVFGIYPARRAASLNPIDALRFE